MNEKMASAYSLYDEDFQNSKNEHVHGMGRDLWAVLNISDGRSQ